MLLGLSYVSVAGEPSENGYYKTSPEQFRGKVEGLS